MLIVEILGLRAGHRHRCRHRRGHLPCGRFWRLGCQLRRIWKRRRTGKIDLLRRQDLGRASHDGSEFAPLFVVDEQFFGQCTLVAQHVDEKTQGAQAVAQALKCRRGRAGGVEGVHQQLLHHGAHAQGRQRRLVQPQDGKNAAHLCQAARYLVQRPLALRLAEELIERLLDEGQGGAQFLHHAAHGLAFADTPVQLLHPDFQRLRRLTRHGLAQTPCQTGAALTHLGVGRIPIVVGGFQIEDGGRDFHGQRRLGGLAGTGAEFHRLAQCGGQFGVFRMQLEHGIGHGGELVHHLRQPCGIAPGQSRPGFRSQCNALACLLHQRRVITPELDALVIDRCCVCQAKRRAHGLQARRRWRALGRFGQVAIEKEFATQSFRRRGAPGRQAGVLSQHARGQALAVHIVRAQAEPDRFKVSRPQLPEAARLLRLMRRCQAVADRRQMLCRAPVSGAHQLQHALVQRFTCARRIGQRCDPGAGRQFLPAPFLGPQIGRMGAVRADDIEHCTVLCKQRHRRSVLSLEHAFQELDQGKPRPLHRGSGFLAARLRLLNEFLRQCFHGVQELGRSALPDHFQRPYGLVQLLPCDAQGTGIQTRQIRSERQFGVAHEAP